jgi:UDP-N-acetyl-D-glucosamine/UDP-N-acetyl-D-galactosamine dehydrogenase
VKSLPPRTLSVTGLGYVGLPVATAFAACGFPVIGFDVDSKRIAELALGVDRTRETDPQSLSLPSLHLTDDPTALRGADFHIVTVPTPISADKRLDLQPLLSASRAVGRALKRGDVVVYESTVFPGATQECCVPVLEAESGLVLGRDFGVGYSPERMNPGDPGHRFETIDKVISASDADTLDLVAAVYGAAVTARIHRAPSIRVAEAAKVIENVQRDVNIALMNEFALIFDRLGISTRDVLTAAGTKWNFLPFAPGLVGGHCIGVDSYYLTAKAESVRYNPEVILSGRRVNDSMGAFIARKALSNLLRRGCGRDARVGILGLTFKENVTDLRNSRVRDIFDELTSFGLSSLIHDPAAEPRLIAREYGVEPSCLDAFHDLDALILAVPHQDYLELGAERIAAMLTPCGSFIDVKSRLPQTAFVEPRSYWSL